VNTVVLVDSLPAVRQGLRLLLGLDPELRIVGEAGDGNAGLALARELRPDVVLMDVNLPGMDGITATAVLRSEHSPSAVIILSLHDDKATRERAQTAGAVAFVSKHAQPDVLVETIRRTASGSYRRTQDGGAEKVKPGAQNPPPGSHLGLRS